MQGRSLDPARGHNPSALEGASEPNFKPFAALPNFSNASYSPTFAHGTSETVGNGGLGTAIFDDINSIMDPTLAWQSDNTIVIARKELEAFILVTKQIVAQQPTADQLIITTDSLSMLRWVERCTRAASQPTSCSSHSKLYATGASSFPSTCPPRSTRPTGPAAMQVCAPGSHYLRREHPGR